MIDFIMILCSKFFETFISSFIYIIHACLNLKAILFIKYGKELFSLFDGEALYPSSLYFDFGFLKKVNYGIHMYIYYLKIII
jgi:hypothetical protein